MITIKQTVLSILFLLFSKFALCQNTDYLKGMPTIDRVMSEIKGNSEMATTAKQAGAFFQLRDMLFNVVKSEKRDPTNDEEQLFDSYQKTRKSLLTALEKKYGRQTSHEGALPEWELLYNKYTLDNNLRIDLEQQLLSADTRNRITIATNNNIQEQIKAVEDSKKDTPKQPFKIPKLLQGILYLCGSVIAIIIGFRAKEWEDGKNLLGVLIYYVVGYGGIIVLLFIALPMIISGIGKIFK